MKSRRSRVLRISDREMNEMSRKKTINMVSQATSVKGQGVGSAYMEQVRLVKEGLADKFEVFENAKMTADITHYHTILSLIHI